MKTERLCLTDELQSRAEVSLKDGLSENLYFIEESQVASASSKTYSGKVGDEADSLKLDMTIDTMALVVDKNESLSLFQKYLSDKIPSGYVLPDENIDFEFKFLNKEIANIKFDYNALSKKEVNTSNNI